MNKIENIRNKKAKDVKKKGTSITLGRSAARSFLISSPPNVTAPGVALRAVRAGPFSDKKADGTTPTHSTTTIRRKPLPPSATINLGSPTLRLANTRDSKDHKNSFHTTYLEQSPRGSDLTIPKRLQPRSQTSKARLGSKEKIASSSKTCSPSARQTVRIKQLGSLGQSSNQLDPLYVSNFRSKKVPIRGTILPKKFGVECCPFDQGLVPPSPAYSTSPPHYSSVQSQEDESAFSDWEIIDWPWVTPYTPATGLDLGLSFPKLQGALPNFMIDQHQHQNHHGIWRKKDHHPPARNKPREKRSQRILNGYLRPSDISGDMSSPFCASKKVFEEEVRTNSYNSAYRVPARRQIEMPSPSRAIELDPAILSQGPTLSNSRLHCVSSNPVFMNMTSGAELSQNESSQKILANNLVEFTKAISQMKKKDRQVVERFLEALKNIEVEDEGNIVGIPTRQEKQKGTKTNRDVLTAPASSLQRKLNPAAPAFSMNIEHGGGQDEVEQASIDPILADHILISPISAMPLQKKKAIKQNLSNVAQGPLQERKAAERNSQSVVVGGKELDGVENRRIGPPQMPVPAYEWASKPARSTEKAQGSARPKGEPVWVKDLVFAAKKLKQVTKRESKASKKPFEIRVDENALPLPSLQYPFAEVNLSLCASIDFDNPPADEGPGRVANAMDPHWAERRLESFKEKYPLTGMVKAELNATPEIPPLSLSKQFASDIQQRLEFVLFQQKEKRALDKLIEELGSSMHSPWI